MSVSVCLCECFHVTGRSFVLLKGRSVDTWFLALSKRGHVRDAQSADDHVPGMNTETN